MTAKLSSLALLAFTAVATAQTNTTTAKTTPGTTPAHRSTAARPTTPPHIPKVIGIPKALYALKYIDTKVGTGALAQSSVLGTSPADSKIMYYTVRYTGWLTDGTKFDSSYDHPGGEPITFPQGVHRVIAGWDTAFQGMHIGGKRRLFIPYQLAYGEAGKPPAIPAKSDLIFDIELVSVSDVPPAPKKPAAPASTPTTTPATPPPAKPATDTPQATPTPKPTTDTPPATSTSPAAQPSTPPHPQSL